ncbi:hypothetical protein PAAG_12418 [Paracoccidioides lutzii Pb01]|uniref:Uncharacterized protein n=1 Tax=Paracoccidioides lutzii (strain ATCC MYA-826 / Pb01) TaxID=502779 RepID=A0A0A2V428_PARBA|nr:hypothetical protein PAAG_12418 [Paracoccidioides lutzii Pb01]KGQ00915.1 hypothetical protein PAAG_12418 [Paracoccidioides lutzii Pb01]
MATKIVELRGDMVFSACIALDKLQGRMDTDNILLASLPSLPQDSPENSLRTIPVILRWNDIHHPSKTANVQGRGGGLDNSTALRKNEIKVTKKLTCAHGNTLRPVGGEELYVLCYHIYYY